MTTFDPETPKKLVNFLTSGVIGLDDSINVSTRDALFTTSARSLYDVARRASEAEAIPNPDKRLLDQCDRMRSQVQETNARLDELIAERSDLTKENSRLAAEVERYKKDYLQACETTARMHAAARGAVVGPARGLVEDVEDLRAQFVQVNQRLSEVQNAREPIVREKNNALIALAETRRELTRVNDAYLKAVTDVGDLTNRVNALIHDINSLRAINTQNAATADNYKKDITSANEALDVAARGLERLKAEKAEAEFGAARWLREVGALRKQVERMALDIAGYQERESLSATQRMELRSRETTLLAEVSDLRTKLAEAQPKAPAVLPGTGSLRERIYEYIHNLGSKGATADEIEDAFNLPHQTCSARIYDLEKKEQRLIDSGQRRTTRSGRKARVLVTMSNFLEAN